MLVIDVSSILEFLLTMVVDDKVDDETEDITTGSEGDVATSILKNPAFRLVTSYQRQFLLQYLL